MAYHKKQREKRFSRMVALLDNEGDEAQYRCPALCAVVSGVVFYAGAAVALAYYALLPPEASASANG